MLADRVALVGLVMGLVLSGSSCAVGEAFESRQAPSAVPTSPPPFPTMTAEVSNRTVTVRLSGPGVNTYERGAVARLERRRGDTWVRINTLIMAGPGYSGEVLRPDSDSTDVPVAGPGPDVFPLPDLKTGIRYRICRAMFPSQSLSGVTVCSTPFAGP
jgi:hypothetical protein